MTKTKTVDFTFLAWLTIVMFLAIPRISNAVFVDSLYDAIVEVPSRDKEIRNQAFKRALASVLVRVTGDRQKPNHPTIKALLSEAPRFIQQYSYREIVDAKQPDNKTYELLVHVDGGAFTQKLTSAGVPVWSADRPSVLVWMGLQRPGKRELVGEASFPEIRQSIQKVSRLRGVPIMHPLLDLQDRKQVKIADIIGRFDDTIRQASQRYRSDVILIANAQTFDDGFSRIHWTLYYRDQNAEWSSENKHLPAAVEDGIHQLGDYLGQRLAVSESSKQSSEVTLLVENIVGLTDYARIDRYLDEISQIVSYQPLELESGRIAYRLKLLGNSDDLERLIDLGNVLGKNTQELSNSSLADTTIQLPQFDLRYRILK